MISIPTLTDWQTLELMDKVALAATDDMLFVEIGVFIGGTLCHLGQKLKELGKKPRLIAVDDWKCNNISDTSMAATNTYGDFLTVFKSNLEKTGLTDIVTIIQGDSIEISKQIQDKSIDFLFIDGNHTYPYMDNELNAWLPKMKENSTVAGHDYCSLPHMPEMINKRFSGNFTLTSNQGTYIAPIGSGLI
jgi:predicted O-methyltransferase YrrM